MSATQNVQFALAAYGFREFSLEEYFRAAVDLGLSAVEIDCGWLPQARNKISVEPSEEKIAEVKRLEGEMGVKVVALGGGAVCGLEGQKILEDYVDEVKRVVDVADALDARIVRVFVEKEPDWSPFTKIRPPTTPDMFEAIGRYFNALGEYAHQKNVVLGIENIGGEIAGNGPDIKRILDMVPYREIGVTYDPANFYGFNPDFEGVDPYQALLCFEDRVVYTHWKDFVRTDKGPEYRKLGEGGIDWPPIINTLLESFDGYWAIEYEMGLGCGMEVLLEGSRTGLRNLRSVIDSGRSRAN